MFFYWSKNPAFRCIQYLFINLNLALTFMLRRMHAFSSFVIIVFQDHTSQSDLEVVSSQIQNIHCLCRYKQVSLIGTSLFTGKGSLNGNSFHSRSAYLICFCPSPLELFKKRLFISLEALVCNRKTDPNWHKPEI